MGMKTKEITDPNKLLKHMTAMLRKHEKGVKRFNYGAKCK